MFLQEIRRFILTGSKIWLLANWLNSKGYPKGIIDDCGQFNLLAEMALELFEMYRVQGD